MLIIDRLYFPIHFLKISINKLELVNSKVAFLSFTSNFYPILISTNLEIDEKFSNLQLKHPFYFISLTLSDGKSKKKLNICIPFIFFSIVINFPYYPSMIMFLLLVFD